MSAAFCVLVLYLGPTLVNFNVKKKSSEVESGYEHLVAGANNNNLEKSLRPIEVGEMLWFLLLVFFRLARKLFKLFSACFCGL